MPQKYQTFQKKEFVRPYTIHPVWRGIGFLMMVLVPIMAGAAAVVLTDLGFQMKWPFMYELTGTIRLPDIFYSIPVIRNIAVWVSSIANLRAILLFFVLFLIVFSGILSVLYALLYRMFGPPRYTPLDAPASKTKVKRYTR
ncbi:MAG: hypothetical protein Fur0016_02280 [Anaerolineales bacterium]